MKVSTLETIFCALNDARVKYLVAGGVAVNSYGYQRMTADLDLVIQLDKANIADAMQCLQDLGYQPLIPVNAMDFSNAETRQEWIEQKNMQVLSLQSNCLSDTTIDIFVTEPFDFCKVYKQAVKAELGPEVQFLLVPLQTLIEMKQLAGRLRDQDDVEHLKVILQEQK